MWVTDYKYNQEKCPGIFHVHSGVNKVHERRTRGNLSKFYKTKSSSCYLWWSSEALFSFPGSSMSFNKKQMALMKGRRYSSQFVESLQFMATQHILRSVSTTLLASIKPISKCPCLLTEISSIVVMPVWTATKTEFWLQKLPLEWSSF